MQRAHLQNQTQVSMEATNTHITMSCPEGQGTDSNSGREADVRIVTSGGLSISAHSKVLASVSNVLEKILDQEQSNSASITIPIIGVPCEAVVTFVRYIYSSRCSEEEMGTYGIHLLALSHVYAVRKLKQICSQGLGVRLNLANVVDVLQLARLCDAPGLYLKCVKLVAAKFDDVQVTEGWRFLQDNDPWLELEILLLLDEAEMEKQRRKERNLCMDLNGVMECLEHIYTERSVQRDHRHGEELDC